jgi:glycosyltransferase involved in cell wall biosynthesis
VLTPARTRRTGPRSLATASLVQALQSAYARQNVAALAGVLLAGGLNYAFHLTALRALSAADYGVVAALLAALALLQTPAVVVGMVSAHLVARFQATGRLGRARAHWDRCARGLALAGLVGALVCLALGDPLAALLQIADGRAIVLLSAALVAGLVLPLQRGTLRGLQRFGPLALNLSCEGLVKLGAAAALLALGLGLEGALFAIVLGLAAAYAVGLVNLGPIFRAPAERSAEPQAWRPWLVTSVSALALVYFQNVDLLVVKALLPPDRAGEYAAVALVGKLIFFATSSIADVLLPTVAARRARGESHRAVVLLSLGLVAAAATLGVAALALLPGLAALPLGDRYATVAPYLPLVGAVALLFAIANLLVNSLLSASSPRLIGYLVGVAALELALLAINHGSTFDVLANLLGIQALLVSGLWLFWLQDGSPGADQLRVLVLNWRCIRHPQAGGAEVFLHETFRRLAAQGHAVTLLCHAFPGAPRVEEVDGVRVRRLGGKWTHPFRALWWYLTHAGEVDVVVESTNKVPYLTPLYVFKPLVALAHHLNGNTLVEQFGPAGRVLALVERLLYLAYRWTRFLAISPSTAAELTRLGIPAASIQLVPVGVTVPEPLPEATRADRPLVLCVNRLKRYKRVHLVIEALPRLIARVPAARLVVVGGGDQRPALERLARERGVADAVQFVGHVDEAEKWRWYRRAWVAVNPSAKEGWGINVIEAATVGVPTIAANVPGLRDSIVDGHTGLLLADDTPERFAEALAALLEDGALRDRLGTAARQRARFFTWERSAERVLATLRSALQIAEPAAAPATPITTLRPSAARSDRGAPDPARARATGADARAA